MSLDNHVINVHLNIPLNLVLEPLVDYPFVHCSHVLQTEGHDFIVVNSSVRDEGGMFLVLGGHLDLVVTQEYIHEHKEFVPQGHIDQLINPREGVAIL